MCSDHGAVDHISGGISLHHLSQRFEHRVEHARHHPSPVTSEHAVPFTIVIRQVPPLRPCLGNPHHAFEIQSVTSCRAAATTRFRRKQRPNDCPFLVRKPNSLAQRHLQKTALNQSRTLLSTFVHEI